MRSGGCLSVDDRQVLCCGYASQFPGLLTWGPQTSRGLRIESRKSMNLVLFLSNRLILPSPVFYFMHLQTLFWGGSVGITRYAGIVAHKQMNKQNNFEPFQSSSRKFSWTSSLWAPAFLVFSSLLYSTCWIILVLSPVHFSHEGRGPAGFVYH